MTPSYSWRYPINLPRTPTTKVRAALFGEYSFQPSPNFCCWTANSITCRRSLSNFWKFAYFFMERLTVLTNFIAILMVFIPLPVVYRVIWSFPNNMTMNVMACRVYRVTKLGLYKAPAYVHQQHFCQNPSLLRFASTPQPIMAPWGRCKSVGRLRDDQGNAVERGFCRGH